MQLVESLEKIVFPMRFTDKLNSVSQFVYNLNGLLIQLYLVLAVQNLCGLSRFSRFRVNSVLNHQLYLGESFLKYILFNSKLEVFNLIPEILN